MLSQKAGEIVSSDEDDSGDEDGGSQPRYMRSNTSSSTTSTYDADMEKRLAAQGGALGTLQKRSSQALPSWQSQRLGSVSTGGEQDRGVTSTPRPLFKKKDDKGAAPAPAADAPPKPRVVKSVFDDPTSMSTADRFVMGTERPNYKNADGPSGAQRKRTLTDGVREPCTCAARVGWVCGRGWGGDEGRAGGEGGEGGDGECAGRPP